MASEIPAIGAAVHVFYTGVFTMAHVQKIAQGYRAFLCVKGKRESATFRTQREANAWAAARETELRTTAKLPPAERYTLGEAIDRYLEEVTTRKRGGKWERIRLEAFRRDPMFPPDRLLGEIQPDDFARWRDSRLREVKPGTVLRELGILSAMFETIRLDWRWIAHNPIKEIRKPPQPQHRDRLITRREIRLMLEAMGYKKGECRSVSQAVAHAFLLALRTGMRAGEICGLRWDQVKPGYFAKVGTKTVPRDVPMSAKTARLIEAMRGYDSVLVIGVKVQTLDALFRKYRERAGLDGFTFHDSRHTAATWMAQKLHVLDLCRAFGWSKTTRALTYFNPAASDIAKRLN